MANIKTLLPVAAAAFLAIGIIYVFLVQKRIPAHMPEKSTLNVAADTPAADNDAHLIRTLDMPGNKGIISLAVAGNSKVLAAVCNGGIVKLWDLERQQITATFDEQRRAGRAVAVSNDGRMVACIGEAGEIELWDVSTKSVKSRLRGHTDVVTALAFIQGGAVLASCSEDQTLRLWDIAKSRELARLSLGVKFPGTMSFSTDEHYVAVAGMSKLVQVLDVPGRSQKLILNNPDDQDAFCATFVNQGTILAYGTYGATLLFDCTKQRTIGRLSAGSNSPTCLLACTRDGKLLASATASARIMVWDVSSLREEASFHAHNAVPTGLAFTPDGKTLITASSGIDFYDRVVDGEVKLWKVR